MYHHIGGHHNQWVDLMLMTIINPTAGSVYVNWGHEPYWQKQVIRLKIDLLLDTESQRSFQWVKPNFTYCNRPVMFFGDDDDDDDGDDNDGSSKMRL